MKNWQKFIAPKKLNNKQINNINGQNKGLTISAWFSGLTSSRKTLLCNLCCSTWGFLAKTLRISATIVCMKKRDDEYAILGDRTNRKSFVHRETKIASNINLINIQVADGKMGLDAPMWLLAKVPHNINSELVVWYVYCFTIIASYNCWWPPTHMLEKYTGRHSLDGAKTMYCGRVLKPFCKGTKLNTNLNSTRNFVAFDLCLNPFIHNKWPCCMNHYTWKEISKYLNSIKHMYQALV